MELPPSSRVAVNANPLHAAVQAVVPALARAAEEAQPWFPRSHQEYRHTGFQPAEQAAPPSLSPIPQLDGSTGRDFPKKCKVCHKYFETRDDVTWHLETKHGREDCQILKSMLQF